MKSISIVMSAIFCAGVVAAQELPLPDYVPQTCDYVKQARGDVVSYTRSNFVPRRVVELERRVIAQVGDIQPDVMNRQQVLDLFGPPPEISIRSTAGAQPEEHLTYSYGSLELYFGPEKTVVHEVRFEKPGPYLYKHKIRVGSTVDELLAVVGAPAETVVGQPIAFEKDRVLFRDVDGETGRGYILFNSEGVRFFLLKDRVSAIYLFKAR